MYKEQFGLRTLPFPSIADPQRFYMNPVYQEALATLQYGVQAHKGIIVFTGPVGSGKTSVVRKFICELGSGIQPMYFDGPQISFAEILRTVITKLDIGVPSGDSVEMMAQLRAFLLGDRGRVANICLIVDEAQTLNLECLEGLRQLTSVSGDGLTSPQLILVGQPELERALDKPELSHFKQRVSLHARLVPLTRTEVSRYMEYHLRCAGREDGKLFAPDAVAAIAAYSGGIPRLVNILSDNALLAAYRQSKDGVSRDLVDEVARELRLAPAVQAKAPEAPRPKFKFEAKEDGVTAAGAQSARKFNLGNKDAPVPKPPIKPSRSFGFGKKLGGTIVILVALGFGSGAVFFVEEARPYIESLKSLTQMAGSKLGSRDSDLRSTEQQPQLAAAPVKQKAQTPLAPATETLSDAEPMIPAEPVKEVTRPSDRDQDRPRPSVATAKAHGPRQERVVEDPQVPRFRDVEIEIHRAINQRAIAGVSVKLVGGRAILGGRVASERQRAAAEAAARGVAHVAGVENFIQVQR